MAGTPLARLLIVDDEETQMKALRDTLLEEGYETMGFTSATQAIEVLDRHRFDLLITDLMMPEMSGIALLEAALKRDPDLAAIIMTGQGTIETAVQAMRIGALDYILKPFKLSIMRPMLSRALAVRQLRIDKAALERRVREHAAALESVNQELEAFSYSVSHDLKAPLRHIKSYLQLLKELEAASLSAEGGSLLERTIEAAEKMNRLINSLLEFARMGRVDLHQHHFSSGELVTEVVQELTQLGGSTSIRWQIATLPQIFGDRTLIKQVWINLLSNAMKYSRHQNPGLIQIDCTQKATEFEFHVRDNGAGFDMKYASKLFGVFQRLHADDEFEGIGIGLANVRRIITRHRGRTWAQAKVGEGASFYFTLPCSSHGDTE